jgi:hypothetical protein
MTVQRQWTTEMITELQALRAAHVPLFLCADHLGMGYVNVCIKARELGLAQRHNLGPRPGSLVASQKNRLRTSSYTRRV